MFRSSNFFLIKPTSKTAKIYQIYIRCNNVKLLHLIIHKRNGLYTAVFVFLRSKQLRASALAASGNPLLHGVCTPMERQFICKMHLCFLIFFLDVCLFAKRQMQSYTTSRSLSISKGRLPKTRRFC